MFYRLFMLGGEKINTLKDKQPSRKHKRNAFLWSRQNLLQFKSRTALSSEAEKDSPKGRFQLALEKESDNVEKWDICSRKEDWLLKNNGFAGVF